MKPGVQPCALGLILLGAECPQILLRLVGPGFCHFLPYQKMPVIFGKRQPVSSLQTSGTKTCFLMLHSALKLVLQELLFYISSRYCLNMRVDFSVKECSFTEAFV